MTGNSFKRLLLLIFYVASVEAWHAAHAQGVPGGVRLPEAPGESAPSSAIRIPAPPPRSEIRPLTAQLSSVRFVGLDAAPAEPLQAIAARWIGKTLSAVEVQSLLNALTTHLRERGLFVAEAYLSRQDMPDGQLEIAVIEGRVGAVHLDLPPGARVSRDFAQDILRPLAPGALVRRGSFDTALLLLNDLPGVRAMPELRAGATPGTADVYVRVEDERIVAGSLRLDNHGIREAGSYQLTGNLRLRNPFGIGDLATVEATSSHTRDLLRGSVSYSLPVNALGTRVGARFTQQEYRVKGDLAALQANGRHASARLMAGHPFLRTNDTNITGFLSVEVLTFRDNIDAAGLTNDIRHHLLTARITGDRSMDGGAVGAARLMSSIRLAACIWKRQQAPPQTPPGLTWRATLAAGDYSARASKRCGVMAACGPLCSARRHRRISTVGAS